MRKSRANCGKNRKRYTACIDKQRDSIGKYAEHQHVERDAAAWLTGLYDDLYSQPDIIKNGFIKAGIEDGRTTARRGLSIATVKL